MTTELMVAEPQISQTIETTHAGIQLYEGKPIMRIIICGHTDREPERDEAGDLVPGLFADINDDNQTGNNPCHQTWIEFGSQQRYLADGLGASLLKVLVNPGKTRIQRGRCREHGPNVVYNAIPPRKETTRV